MKAAESAGELQAELAREKQSHTEAEARLAEAKAAQAKAAEAMAVLKQKLVDDEERSKVAKKQAQELEQLREELAKLRKARSAVEREAEDVKTEHGEMNQAIGVFNTRLASVQTNLNLLQERAGAIEQARSELLQEQAAHALSLEQLEKGKTAATAAAKEKVDLQKLVAELDKQISGAADQRKALEQLKVKVAKEKKARTEAEAQLASAVAAQTADQQATADLRRKIVEIEERLDKQTAQDRELKNLQAELSKEQKERKAAEAKARQEAEAQAVLEQEHSELKSRLTEVEQQYAIRLEQQKVMAQAQSGLKREKELRKQTEKLLAETAAKEKDLAEQNRELSKQLQTAAEKSAALAEELDRQMQLAAKSKTIKPESAMAVEKKTGDEAGSTAVAQEAGKTKVAKAGSSAGSEAQQHYQAGIQKWDAGDIDGAIAEFKRTVSLDANAAGAYYNIALGYSKKDDRDEACDYAYKAAQVYLNNRNTKQATRMVVFIKNVDPTSPLIEKLRKEIAEKAP
ncbi:MAG: hypothetical protein HYV35_12875 [Lentisphaerae bacterium]|nr:hypothetical protein [Lentisphaerota bacterium]